MRVAIGVVAALLWLPSAVSAQGVEIKSPYDAVPLANQAFEEERYRDAADLYAIALADLPDSPELHFNQGNTYFKLEDLAQATAEYMRALETESRPLAAQIYYNLGNVHYRRAINAMRTFRDAVAPLREAMQSYRDALALDPDLVDAMYNLELADRLFDELSKQRVEKQANPHVRDQSTSASQGQFFDEETGDKPSESQDEEAEANSDAAGEQGETAPQGQPPDDQGAQADPDGGQREMSAEEAQEMVELVRDKARAAEAMRQQWRQSRMRDSAAEKPW
jgi:Ca-activated chloride channel homolog